MNKLSTIFSKEYLEKNKNKLYELFGSLKRTITNNSELYNITKNAIQDKSITTEEKELLLSTIKDTFKLVGISTMAIVTLPIPMSTLLLISIVKLANKMGFDILPSEFSVVYESKDDDNDIIDITKMTKQDWDNLQEQVKKDCFNVDDKDIIEILDVKINKRRTSAAFFYFSININYIDQDLYRYRRIIKKISNYFVLDEKDYSFTTLKVWTKQDLKNTMAHEMIHYYCTLKYGNVGHGKEFKREMNRINNLDNEYRVTEKDDEFVLASDMVKNKENDIYLFVLSRDVDLSKTRGEIKDIVKLTNNVKLSSSTNKEHLSEPNTKMWLKGNGIRYINIFSLDKLTKIKYGVTNQQKVGLYTYKNSNMFKDRNPLQLILENTGTKYIETIDLGE